MTQFDTLKLHLKEVVAQKEALEHELIKMEDAKIGIQAVCFVLGVFFIASNAAWFALWNWVR